MNIVVDDIEEELKADAKMVQDKEDGIKQDKEQADEQ